MAVCLVCGWKGGWVGWRVGKSVGGLVIVLVGGSAVWWSSVYFQVEMITLGIAMSKTPDKEEMG